MTTQSDLYAGMEPVTSFTLTFSLLAEHFIQSKGRGKLGKMLLEELGLQYQLEVRQESQMWSRVAQMRWQTVRPVLFGFI